MPVGLQCTPFAEAGRPETGGAGASAVERVQQFSRRAQARRIAGLAPAQVLMHVGAGDGISTEARSHTRWGDGVPAKQHAK
jgi:hypothetical protein